MLAPFGRYTGQECEDMRGKPEGPPHAELPDSRSFRLLDQFGVIMPETVKKKALNAVIIRRSVMTVDRLERELDSTSMTSGTRGRRPQCTTLTGGQESDAESWVLTNGHRRRYLGWLLRSGEATAVDDSRCVCHADDPHIDRLTGPIDL